jgi:hypothetical protein
MRLDLLDEATRRFVLSLLSSDHVGTRRRRPSGKAALNARRGLRSSPVGHRSRPSRPDFHTLAEELIAKCCDRNSMGHIYGFLLSAYRSPEKAKLEFVKFLSGRWSQEWVEAAHRAVSEDHQTPQRPQVK